MWNVVRFQASLGIKLDIFNKRIKYFTYITEMLTVNRGNLGERAVEDVNSARGIQKQPGRWVVGNAGASRFDNFIFHYLSSG
jgi:hypothetical protein